MTQESALLKLGQLGRPHGLKGEIGANWQAEYTPRTGDMIFLQKDGASPSAMRIASSRWNNGRLLLKFDGVDSRTAAEPLNGAVILMHKGALPPLAEEEAYIADIIGYDIYLPDGEHVGKLDHVEFPAGQLIWAITGETGSEILFPANPAFIASIDMQAKKIVIEPPAGLLDIYRA